MSVAAEFGKMRSAPRRLAMNSVATAITSHAPEVVGFELPGADGESDSAAAKVMTKLRKVWLPHPGAMARASIRSKP